MANDNTPRRTGPISTSGKVGYVLLVFIALLIGMVIFTGMFGRVGGSELDPYTLNSRDFTYYEIPVIHVQVMPTARYPSSNKLQQWINKDEKVLQAPSAEKRWDLIEGGRTGAKTVPGGAMVLAEYLNAVTNTGDFVWLNWSTEHKTLARKLWPRVAWLAQHNLYFLIPDLMDFAKATDKSPNEFAEEADLLLKAKLKTVAGKIREAGDPERAAAILEEAQQSKWQQLEREPSVAEDEHLDADKLDDGGDDATTPEVEAPLQESRLGEPRTAPGDRAYVSVFAGFAMVCWSGDV